MLRLLTITAMLMLISSPGSAPPRAPQRPRRSSKGSPSDVIDFVVDAFGRAGVPGSLVTGGTCNAPNSGSDAVSDVLPNPPSGPFHSIDAALTALVKADPRVSWRRGPDGVIRVWDGKVPEGLLHLRLKQVHLRDRARAWRALNDILSAPGVRVYFRKKHLRWGLYSTMGGITSGGGTKGLPRLSATMRNVTVEQALDRVAEFFRGVWIYSYCQSGPRRLVVITLQY